MADQSTEARLREALEGLPYQAVFNAIGDAITVPEGRAVGISVEKFTASLRAALSLPVQDTSDELTHLRAEVEAMREERSRSIQFAGGQSPLICGSGSARSTLNGEQANG